MCTQYVMRSDMQSDNVGHSQLRICALTRRAACKIIERYQNWKGTLINGFYNLATNCTKHRPIFVELEYTLKMLTVLSSRKSLHS
jgi:hypothetical protein